MNWSEYYLPTAVRSCSEREMMSLQMSCNPELHQAQKPGPGAQLRCAC